MDGGMLHVNRMFESENMLLILLVAKQKRPEV